MGERALGVCKPEEGMGHDWGVVEWCMESPRVLFSLEIFIGAPCFLGTRLSDLVAVLPLTAIKEKAAAVFVPLLFHLLWSPFHSGALLEPYL